MLILLKNLSKFGLTGSKIFPLMAISILAAVFEGFGMAMFLPLMEYIEKDKNLSVLTQGSNLWKRLVGAFDYLGVEVTLLSLIVSVLILMFLRIIFMYLRRLYFDWLSQDTLHYIRTKVFNTYLYSNYGFYSSVSTGYKVNLINVEGIRTIGALASLFEMISNALVIAGFVIVLLWVSAPMTAFAALFLALAGVVVSYYIRHTKKLGGLITASNEKLSFLLIERLTAFRLLKLTDTISREIENIKDASQKVRDYNYWTRKLNARVDLLLEPMVVLGASCIFFISIVYFQMTLSMLGLFMLILLRLMPLCKQFLRSRQSFLANIGGFEAVMKGLEKAEKEPEISGGSRLFMGLKKGIRLSDLTFIYPGNSRSALLNVNIFFPAGRMTAIVGPSGAGKSTLVDLLPRLRVPQKGQVLFDDHPVETYDLGSLRRGLGFVSQDAFIFNDSVFGNITFAQTGMNEEEVWEVLEKAGGAEFVRQMPNGLYTVLGERGVNLSGGQKQRLSLARALMQKAPVLILDEPTSSLDSESEKHIQRAINEIMAKKNITMITIAHRLSTIKNADQIIVLDKGRVLECGSHRELMHDHHWYAEMVKIQAV